MDAPDKWDRTYYHQQITGFGRLLNLQAAESKSQYELITGLRMRIEKLELERIEDAALISELRARLEETESMREELRKVWPQLSQMCKELKVKEKKEVGKT